MPHAGHCFAVSCRRRRAFSEHLASGGRHAGRPPGHAMPTPSLCTLSALRNTLSTLRSTRHRSIHHKQMQRVRARALMRARDRHSCSRWRSRASSAGSFTPPMRCRSTSRRSSALTHCAPGAPVSGRAPRAGAAGTCTPETGRLPHQARRRRHAMSPAGASGHPQRQQTRAPPQPAWPTLLARLETRLERRTPLPNDAAPRTRGKTVSSPS